MPSLWKLRGVYRQVGTNKFKRWCCYQERALGRTRGGPVEVRGLCLARLRVRSEPYGRLQHRCEADALAQKYTMVNVVISYTTEGPYDALKFRRCQ